jgi:hypothetical protein
MIPTLRTTPSLRVSIAVSRSGVERLLESIPSPHRFDCSKSDEKLIPDPVRVGQPRTNETARVGSFQKFDFIPTSENDIYRCHATKLRQSRKIFPCDEVLWGQSCIPQLTPSVFLVKTVLVIDPFHRFLSPCPRLLKRRFTRLGHGDRKR